MMGVIEFVKKWAWVIGVFATVMAIGGSYAIVKYDVANAKEKNKSQDSDIADLKKVIYEQNVTQQKLAVLIESQNEKIDLILSLLAIKVSDTTLNRWKQMPRELPKDSLGKPIPNKAWLVISENYLLGRSFKFIAGDTLLVRVEWDKRPKE